MKQRRAAYESENSERVRDTLSRYRRANKDAKLYKLYGITRLEWNELLASQDHRCAICKTEDGGKRGFDTDHCHNSKKVRGILCRKCNVMLGHARDNITTLEAAIQYLQHHTANGQPQLILGEMKPTTTTKKKAGAR